MRMRTTDDVSKRSQFIINEAAKVTLGYTFVDYSSTGVIFVVHSTWNGPVYLGSWWFNSPNILLWHFENSKTACVWVTITE